MHDGHNVISLQLMIMHDIFLTASENEIVNLHIYLLGCAFFTSACYENVKSYFKNSQWLLVLDFYICQAN